MENGGQFNDFVNNKKVNNPDEEPTLKSDPDSPFKNELILEKIFKLLSKVEDLLSCRLVCIQWAILGSKSLRNDHCPITPVNIVGVYEDKVKFRIHELLKLKESSLNLPQLKDSFPYTRFLLGEYGCDLGVTYISKFFNLLTPITHLGFSSETLNNTQISTFREILMFHLPNCESIELLFPRYGYLEFPYLFPPKMFSLLTPILPQVNQLILRLPTDRTDFVPQFIKDLFRAVPFLVTLKLFEVHHGFLEFLLSKEVLLDEIPLLKLKHLEINLNSENGVEMNQNDLEKLKEVFKKYLKLETFKMSSLTDCIELRSQVEFLASLAPQLKELRICKFSYFEGLSPLGTNAIYLKYFKTLELSELPPLDFLFQSLPKLKTLILGKVTSDLFPLRNLSPTVLIDAYPVHPLQRLVLPKGLIDPDAIPKILKGLPNLKKLKLSGDDKTLRSIFKCGGALKELILFEDSVVTDWGITGIPWDICRKIYKSGCELPEGVNCVDDLRGDQPWIANLKGLEVFKMTECDEKGLHKNRISNVSIVFGFRFCKQMTHLAIPKTWINNFSLYYIGKYYGHNLIALELNLCYWLTPPALENLKDQRPHLQIKFKEWYNNLVSKHNRSENIIVPSNYHFMTF